MYTVLLTSAAYLKLALQDHTLQQQSGVEGAGGGSMH
jgi:hypothetical protein